jgi:hypothetical protein
MTENSTPDPDPRFAEAEAEVEHGRAWRFREDDSPNPLTILATHWSTGYTKLGTAEFLNGTDRDGQRWSVLVGGVVLRQALIEGLVKEYDQERREFLVILTLGRVQPGEVVSIRYLGNRESAQYNYPDFKISRKPAPMPRAVERQAPPLPLLRDPQPAVPLDIDDEIPF